ncbi:MAG TPA: lanthionine synthetase C family protein [Cyclobacteriaceae bacterium]|nr:lanthionine synthetase C family protein [Cyclobacteriaceae bacterium]
MSNKHFVLVKNKLTEIANYLAKDDEGYVPLVQPCLFNGKIGEALFFMYYSRYTKNEDYYDLAIERIERSMELIDKGYYSHTHASGLSGIFWALDHFIEQDFISDSVRESMAPFDQYLGDIMLENIAKGEFDFLHGALGVAHYFIKRRKHNPDLDLYLENLIKGLHHCAIEVDADTIKWHSTLSNETGEPEPNICLSHGMSSIAIMLSKFINANIAVKWAIPLLHQTINYILSQEIDSAHYISCFPSTSLERRHQQFPSRIAWCYGDLGVGIALCQAGKAVNINQWYKKGLEVLMYSCSRQDLHMNKVFDAGICHGTAGVAHVYDRLYIDTDLPIFEKAALYWHHKTLDFGMSQQGIAGFKPYFPNVTVDAKEFQRGFLMGISGIGLSLLHAVSDIPPAWDECLLLS